MAATPSAGRVVALDVARCLALLGMVATHVLEERTPDGDLAVLQWLAGGRASALFAVLAGVTLALATGGPRPVVGRERAARSAGLASRALLVALVGLALGGADSGIAVILTYYGVLFLLGLPFAGLGPRALAALAALWVVAAPVLSHAVRPALPDRQFESPTFAQLADPARLLSELTFTGYYPAVPWLAYLLAGMALGRLDLRALGARGAALLAAGGALLATAATALSRTLVDAAVLRTLEADVPTPAVPGLVPATLEDQLEVGLYGTTPTGAWEWLLVVAPHSATPPDLAQTIGSALLAVGACLLLLQGLERVGPAAVTAVRLLTGAGAMTFTLYALHVLMRSPDLPPAEVPESFRTHVLVLLAIGLLYAAAGRRGPLEALARLLSRGTATLVRGRSSADEGAQAPR